MLLKKADDKTKRIELLQNLQQASVLDEFQKKWLRGELDRYRKGIEGEREAAFYLDSHFKDSKNHVLMHDLRFVVDDEVAQIDHLAINRGFEFYLFETKNFNCNLHINARGEFTAEYRSIKTGIASPLEQSRRHSRILTKLLERLDIGARVGDAGTYHHVVLLHPKAIIHRPDAKVLDTSMVIKADQIATWHNQFAEQAGVGHVLRLMANMRSTDTIREWAEKLLRQHRPVHLLELPDFMQPKRSEQAASPAASATPAAAPVQPITAVGPVTDNGSLARKLICAHCRAKISFPEGKFCWNQEKRFAGLQYCREHQALFA